MKYLIILAMTAVLCTNTPLAAKEQKDAPPSPRFGTFYSAQKPHQPALPFNPRPELPLIEVTHGIFVFDDSDVDYEGEAMMMSSSSDAPPAPGPGGGPQPPPILSPHSSTLGLTSLWVNISRNPPTNFFLDVFNTTPGVRYGVGAKSTIDPDPFNTWSLVNVFDAQWPTQRLTGAASSPMRFFGAVNLNQYLGPTVRILSPGSNTTVSGDVPLEVAVNDILPLLTVEVFVGETSTGSIRPGQGGRISVPSYWFPNGAREIWVRVVNEGVPVDTDGDGVADSPSPIASWASVPVTFSNEVYMTSYSQLYSASGFITLDYAATTPQDYTFEVFRLNGQLLQTQSGLSSGGSINAQWNFTDQSGQPVNDSGYVFSLAASPQSGMAAAAATTTRTIRTTNFFDKGVTVAKYLISYGEWPRQDLNELLADMNRAVSARVNFSYLLDEDIIGPYRDAHGIIRADFSSEPYAIRGATQTNDLAALTNALADPLVGAWLWDGHAGGNSIILGGDAVPFLNVRLWHHEIAGLLGNNVGIPFFTNLVYNRRLHATINTGCRTINGFLPIATGTPPGVKQIGNPWIKKSAFVGFNGDSRTGEIKMGWIVSLHNHWIDGDQYDTWLATAFGRANIDYPDVVPWAPEILGYPFIRYDGQGSR